MADLEPDRDLRSYGRRRARAPSARQKALWQETLPRVALPQDAGVLRSLPALFTPPVREVWLEIGFGGGEHLVALAQANPDVGLIGCEPFEDGVVKVLAAIEREGLGNVRIHADDARPLLRRLPEASIARIFMLFPDPWPKKRHHKRRLVSPATLAEIARIAASGAELRLATDIPAYACAMLLALRDSAFRWTATCADDWRRRPPDWPQTRYEAKALREGRRCTYFRFRRT